MSTFYRGKCSVLCDSCSSTTTAATTTTPFGGTRQGHRHLLVVPTTTTPTTTSTTTGPIAHPLTSGPHDTTTPHEANPPHFGGSRSQKVSIHTPASCVLSMVTPWKDDVVDVVASPGGSTASTTGCCVVSGQTTWHTYGDDVAASDCPIGSLMIGGSVMAHYPGKKCAEVIIGCCTTTGVYPGAMPVYADGVGASDCATPIMFPTTPIILEHYPEKKCAEVMPAATTPGGLTTATIPVPVVGVPVTAMTATMPRTTLGGLTTSPATMVGVPLTFTRTTPRTTTINIPTSKPATTTTTTNARTTRPTTNTLGSAKCSSDDHCSAAETCALIIKYSRVGYCRPRAAHTTVATTTQPQHKPPYAIPDNVSSPATTSSATTPAKRLGTTTAKTSRSTASWWGPLGPLGPLGPGTQGARTPQLLFVSGAQGQGALSRPVVAKDNHVYVSSQAGRVFKFTARTGVQVWSSPVSKSFSSFSTSACTVVGGILYVGNSDAHVYAYNTTTGNLLFAYESDGGVHGAPLAADGTLFYGSDGNFMYAWSLRHARPLWLHRTNDPVISAAVYANGCVYFCSTEGTIYSLSADDGSVKWTYRSQVDSVTAFQIDRPRATAAPLVLQQTRWGYGQGLVVLSSYGGTVHAANQSTGLLVWTYTMAKVTSSPVAIPAYQGTAPGTDTDLLVCMASWDSHVYALHPAGVLQWKHKGDSPFIAAPAVYAGVVYATSLGGSIYGLRAFDGVSRVCVCCLSVGTCGCVMRAHVRMPGCVDASWCFCAAPI